MRALPAFFTLLIAAPAAAQNVTVEVFENHDGSLGLLHRVIVPAPPDDVWRAIATDEGWREWAVPLVRHVPGTDRFETSYDADAAPNAPNTIEQEWVVRAAPAIAIYRTTRTPAVFSNQDVYLKVQSAFFLQPVGEGMTQVVHKSSSFPANTAGYGLLRFFAEGNKETLEQLRERFVSGPKDWSAGE
jgi:uncharacterized protein YndB with AHSA1/START domain